MKKIVILVLALMLFSLESGIMLANSEKAAQIIYIRPDGSVDPATEIIQRNENTYSFTKNAYVSIVVEKANVIIDGAGYALQGTYKGAKTDPYTVGIEISELSRCNVTVTNLTIKNVDVGVFVWTSNHKIIRNTISSSAVAILLPGSSNNITENYIVNNTLGIFRVETSNNAVYHNNFINNTVQISECNCTDRSTIPSSTWDNGAEGNYWSDYNGTDSNGDGIGDTPYVIDEKNQDNRPLMNQWIRDNPTEPQQPDLAPLMWIIATAVITSTAALGVYLFRKPRKSASATKTGDDKLVAKRTHANANQLCVKDQNLRD